MLIRSSHKARLLLRTSLYFFLGIVVTVGLIACSQRDQQVQLSGQTMGTTYHVKLITPEAIASPEVLQQKIDDTLAAINQSMSTYIEDSELSRLNHAPVDTWVEVSQPLLEVLLISRDVSEASGGAFDITAGPLVNLWGFGPQKHTDEIPDEHAIQKTLERVGYKLLEIDAKQRRVRKLKDIYLDLSAVAKGYATDAVTEQLRAQEFNNSMVEIGGELRLSGFNAQAKPWRIGIEKPGLLHEGTQQTVDISDGGMATSGDYRNYFELNGERYSHLIDPSNGRPVRHLLASVTVITDSGARADAYATALHVLGPDRGYDLAYRLKLAAFFIVREEEGFSVKYTPEFERYLVDL